REHVIKMSTNGGCFIGASLSCTDLLVYLYEELLRVSPAHPDDPHRDFLLLSKGHDVPALYGVLAEKGFFPRERLAHHLSPRDTVYWHPNRNLPGVEFHAGSLGHLLAVSIGIALDVRLRGGSNRVVVVLGDGELNEGSVWEGALVAAGRRLENLLAVVDRNQFQANLRTEELLPLEPLEEKFKAFGWSVRRTDGHSFDALEQALTGLPFEPGRPGVVIADTVRGKGLPSIENRADRWFVNFSRTEVAQLLVELHGQGRAVLTSETVMVR
ncbi:MAG TPA: 1-deoxy-D-xylulose-5-phosphate synthase N-terminal domain-containing protein, partial [Bacteroidota bacterium]